MIYLLDSSAILNDFGFSFYSNDLYIISPLIAKEFKDMRSKLLVNAAIHSKVLEIREPSQEALTKVKAESISKGMNCSDADLSVLGLALDLREEGKKFELITDDHSIQNLSISFKIPFKSIIQGTIKKQISIARKCPNCRKEIPKEGSQKVCDFCGANLD